MIAMINHRFNRNRRRILRMLGLVTLLPFLAKSVLAKTKVSLFHHLPNGKFRNNYIEAINKPFSDLMRWRREAPAHPLLSFPLAKTDVDFLRTNQQQNTITWIGHATLLLQIGGMNILTDPHFTERASPFSFAGPKRGTPPSINPQDLPNVDVVLISHNHYDHLDSESIIQIAKLNPKAQFFCPLGLRSFLEERGAKNIHELDWWQEVTIANDMRIAALPCQHWSSRFPWDRNSSLWAAWAVLHPQSKFLFIGDTGYSADFADIGERYGGFDWVAIPIGAYQPRWFMQQAHINPDESVRIFLDVKAQHAIATHWGTFKLTDEPMDEPPQKLKEAAAQHGIAQFHVFQHGEMRNLT